MREFLAALIKPADPGFRGRQEAPPTYGLRRWMIYLVVIVFGVVVIGWLKHGWFTSRGTSEPLNDQPKRPLAEVSTPLPTTEFPNGYEMKPPPVAPIPQPAAPPLLAAPASLPELVKKDENWHIQMQAKLDTLWLAYQDQKARMAKLEAQGHTSTTGTPPHQSAANALNAAKAQAAKDLLAARKQPLFHEATPEKTEAVGVRPLTNPYTLAGGWLIPIVIEDQITNQAPGIAKFIVTGDVKDSATGQYTLIPQGSWGILRTQGGQVFGSTRLPAQVVSVTMPNGDDLVLPKAQASDQRGAAGFADQLDRRWGSVLASVLVTSVLRSGTAVMSGVGSTAGERIGSAVASETVNQGQRTAQQFINTSPIMTIRNGYRASIRLEERLVIGKAYDR